jgi:hypothetical protein
MLGMTWTTYCMKHETLETVDEVTKVAVFAEDELAAMGVKAFEVHGVTDAGCKVNFVGGPQWRQS